MISSNERTVTAGITAVLAAPEPVNVAATLIYSAGDPYAVQVSFHTGEEPVHWCFARELLAAGLDGPAPEFPADVRVWPDEEQGLLSIGLSSPFGSAVFETEEAPVAEFLARAYQLVPEGEEPAYLDLDADLAELLGEAR